MKYMIGLVNWNTTIYEMYIKNMTKIHTEFTNNFQFEIGCYYPKIHEDSNQQCEPAF